MRTRTFIIASLLAATTVASLAQGVGRHPAVPGSHPIQGVDPSTFLVGHPASPTWQLRHANHEHPAIAMRRQASRLDPNTVIVQPPAHVEWTNPGAERTGGLPCLDRGFLQVGPCACRAYFTASASRS
jgi:hypothetical protein